MKLNHDELLSRHTSFKIGGKAWRWLEPEHIEDILEGIESAEKNNKAFIVFGSGTNILARDSGFDGIVIHLNKKNFGAIERQGEELVKVGAGTAISELVKEASGWGLSGCEFLKGLPGNFGGAVFMNAGVRDADNTELFREIKDIVVDIDVLDINDKKQKTLKKDAIDFTYRSSGLDNKIILWGRLGLKKDTKDNILTRTARFMKKRAWIKNLGYPTAGSVFKNPDKNNPAGKLIEQCGLKGKRIGNAMISELHANFIVNVGGALAKDVLDLIELARKSVKEKFGTDLELEIKVV